ncbi:hypothetical protein CB1_001241003 [Camelus ferus]|nr:hypothetical protein CB1_001241003 [Camelus ferus]
MDREGLSPQRKTGCLHVQPDLSVGEETLCSLVTDFRQLSAAWRGTLGIQSFLMPPNQGTERPYGLLPRQQTEAEEHSLKGSGTDLCCFWALLALTSQALTSEQPPVGLL